jgi:hypothetical protein
VLRQVFMFAYANDAIAVDLAAKLRQPVKTTLRQAGRRRPEAYSGEEWAAFLQAAE